MVAGEACAGSGLPAGVYDTAILDALPGKQPLIKLSYRPPNYETPVPYFKTAITPNDAFFVRYHLADIPDQIDANRWRLQVGGEAAVTPLQLTLDELQTGFEQVEIVAACQCSGNRRGCSQPHVPNVQWGPCAMGNAVLARRSAQGRAHQGGIAQGGDRDRRQWRRWPGARQDPGFRQEHPGVEGARRKHDHCPSHERAAAAALSTVFRRASSCPAGPPPTG
jgi:DMSO/TMAO reductase YedYZ molybdopterin-dependent catalytic subunit